MNAISLAPPTSQQPRSDPERHDSGQSVVQVDELTKTYAPWSLRGRSTVEALRGVSLHADAGEVFGLLGPNGAGKTTLIKILLGVVTASSGTATLFGQPVGSIAARMRVGYLPESLRVDRHHSARTALKYYGRMSRMASPEIARRSDELLELVGLRGRDRESVRQFSKGMYQRLGLAQALMHDPDLLVLDEPTDGLDPVGRNEVRIVINRLRESGKTIFLNSHILQEVELICSRVAIMAKGKICAVGRIDELTRSDRFQQVAFEVSDADAGAGQLAARLSPLFPQMQLGPRSGGPMTATSNADSPSSLHFSLPLTSQQQVDDAVDRIRGLGLSLRGLVLKRASLEETFMQAVQGSEAPPTEPADIEIAPFEAPA
ncbi:ABC transporter ATP-binding protein [Novipirellula artificiosorum]|uniref:Putative ABC transporter ATP-binding protein YxlF n=1 Tax=Novipirellula artificiosorum TaxID=2528016 RepID=A0A5C6E5I8_9BACT|nr:ABC transporter ATP-binding protein [Novipirellula artificiosorum]TWU42861.1 putative ABC transporter ATP-binding protein YxlF [Novipirellula artificiosorum]